jgi:hypothetical protein
MHHNNSGNVLAPRSPHHMKVTSTLPYMKISIGFNRVTKIKCAKEEQLMSNNKTKNEEGIVEIPKEGWKSITLPSEIYDIFYNEWNGHRDGYLLKGITSFSGFMTMLLAEPLQEFKKKAESKSM